MKWVLVFPLILASFALSAAPVKSKVPHHTSAQQSAANHTVAARTASSKSPSSSKSRSKTASTGKARLVAVRRGGSDPGMSRSARSVRAARGGRYMKVSALSYQTHPDPDRYQAIQKALVEKGYFKGEPNGTWSAESTDALKRFQADQKLTDDGKINALTLTGLGLGPKHGAADQISNSPLVPVVEPPAAPQSVPPPPAGSPLPQAAPQLPPQATQSR